MKFVVNRLKLWILARRCNSVIHRSVNISGLSKLALGQYCYIGAKCFINCSGGVSIGAGTIISSRVVVLSDSHDFNDVSVLPYGRGYVKKEVNIGRGVWVGYGAMLLPGINVGDGAIIGAGSVVTKDVRRGQIVAGNPAVVVRDRQICIEELVEKECFLLRLYRK